MTVFKIVHPNGCIARVRAHHARIAVSMLADELHDSDWQYGQTLPLREDPGPSAILTVGNPRIPTTHAERPRHP